MIFRKLKVFLPVLFLAGCISSSYPLVSKEESVSLVEAGTYCLVPKGVSVSQGSQCGWVRVKQGQDNGYIYEVTDDPHDRITDHTSLIKEDKSYYARVLNTPISGGYFANWKILQSCESPKACTYFAVRLIEGGFDVAVPSMLGAANNVNTVQTKAALMSEFSKLTDKPEKIITFYSPAYLDAKSKQRAQKYQQIKQMNEGDL